MSWRRTSGTWGRLGHSRILESAAGSPERRVFTHEYQTTSVTKETTKAERQNYHDS